jgi:hypothetical protein
MVLAGTLGKIEDSSYSLAKGTKREEMA